MGAKQGRTKGNKQKTEYAKPDEADGKPAVNEGEKRRGRKEPSLDGSCCEAKVQRAERKKQKLSSRNRKRSGRKKADRKGTDRKRKHKVST